MKKSTIIGLVTAGSIVTVGAAAGIGVSIALKHHKSSNDAVKTEDRPTIGEVIKEGIHELVHGPEHPKLSTLELVNTLKSGSLLPGDVYDVIDENGKKIDEIHGPDFNEYLINAKSFAAEKPLATVIKEIDKFNSKAYYYAKGGEAESNDKNVRINFFAGYLLHHSYFLPSNIQIEDVSKPHTLTHNVKATLKDVKTGSTDSITVDYNQEDDAESARAKNEHGWFIGGVQNIGRDLFHSIGDRASFVKDWLADHNMGWATKLVPFLATRGIAQLILSGMSLVVGGPVIVPLVPLWGISYLIWKGVSFAGKAII